MTTCFNVKGILRTFLVVGLMALGGMVAVSSAAFAACTSPAASAGVVEYFSGDNVYRYCNGTDWVDVGGAGGLWTAGSGDDIYYNSGTPRVGIGTDSPSEALEVAGNARFSETTSSIHLRNATSAAGGYWLASTGSPNTGVGFNRLGFVLYNNSNISWRSGTQGSTQDTFLSRVGAGHLGVYESDNTTLGQFSAGTVTLGTISASSGLTLDVEGNVGAVEYCDENGDNCFAAASVGGAGGLWTAGSGDDIYYNSGTPQVGIGTAAPDVMLHVESPNVGDSAQLFKVVENSNTIFDVTARDGATLRLGASRYFNITQDGALKTSWGVSGGVPQLRSADSFGLTLLSREDDSGAPYGLALMNDVVMPAGVPLLKVGVGTNDTTTAEYFRIDDDGSVGINNSNPAYDLDVTGDVNYSGTLTNVSDRRLKDDIVPLDVRGTMLDRLDRVGTYSYVMKDDEAKRVRFGVIAQELEEVFPELVHTQEDGFKSVRYVELIAPMIEASKELRAENAALRMELAAVKADIKGLKVHTGYGVNRAAFGLLFLMSLMMAGMVVVVIRRKA